MVEERYVLPIVSIDLPHRGSGLGRDVSHSNVLGSQMCTLLLFQPKMEKSLGLAWIMAGNFAFIVSLVGLARK